MKLNKKGFTLIELLAVIVILGVIMLIAIPSVSSIIANSRRNTFRSTAQTLISGARNMVLASPSGTPEVGADTPWKSVANVQGSSIVTTGSYIIKIENIEVESGSNTDSPFGVEYDQEYSFVIAIPDGAGNFDYYIQIVDNDHNYLTLTREDELDGVSIGSPEQYDGDDFKSFTQYTTA